MTISAVVVTYNRKALLLECLEALRKQTMPPTAICIVDNASTDGTAQLLADYGYLHDQKGEQGGEQVGVIRTEHGDSILIHYLRLSENLGGAGGFYHGIAYAFAKGYDWFWLMDDDAQPAPEALERLLPFVNLPQVAALGSLTCSVHTGEAQSAHQCRLRFDNPLRQFLVPLSPDELQSKVVPIDQKSFVGLFLSRQVVEQVGLPRREFFLHWDDTEYCIRIRQAGGRIYLVPASIVWHKDAAPKAERIAYRLGIFTVERYARRDPYRRYWLRYFTERNFIWLALQYTTARWRTIGMLGLRILRGLGGILLFDDHKWRRVRLLFRMYWDGVRGDFDARWRPRWILYGDRAELKRKKTHLCIG